MKNMKKTMKNSGHKSNLYFYHTIIDAICIVENIKTCDYCKTEFEKHPWQL